MLWLAGLSMAIMVAAMSVIVAGHLRDEGSPWIKGSLPAVIIVIIGIIAYRILSYTYHPYIRPEDLLPRRVAVMGIFYDKINEKSGRAVRDAFLKHAIRMETWLSLFCILFGRFVSTKFEMVRSSECWGFFLPLSLSGSHPTGWPVIFSPRGIRFAVLSSYCWAGLDLKCIDSRVGGAVLRVFKSVTLAGPGDALHFNREKLYLWWWDQELVHLYTVIYVVRCALVYWMFLKDNLFC